METATASGEVTAEDVAQVVAKATGIVTTLTQEQSQRLPFEEELHRQVGQDQAVTAVAKPSPGPGGPLKTRPPHRLFHLWPTGGKTELTKALAKALWQREQALIRLDMSEYMKPMPPPKWWGASGYVGYGGQLTERIRRRPHSVVLFDGLRKPIQMSSICCCKSWRTALTDSQGRRVSFQNAVIIMTSNLGAGLSPSGRTSASPAGGEDDDKRIRSDVPELRLPSFCRILNRVDDHRIPPS